MWGSKARHGGGSEHNMDDADSIFDVRSAFEFPVTHLHPHQESQKSPSSKFTSPFSSSKLAVDGNAHRKGESLGQRARRAAHRLWPGASSSLSLAFDSEDTMSVPSDTMSLSTITDSFSNRSSIPLSMASLSLRPEPIDASERQARNSASTGDKVVPLDTDSIIQDMLRLDLNDDEIDELVSKLPNLAPYIGHIRDREFSMISKGESSCQTPVETALAYRYDYPVVNLADFHRSPELAPQDNFPLKSGDIHPLELPNQIELSHGGHPGSHDDAPAFNLTDFHHSPELAPQDNSPLESEELSPLELPGQVVLSHEKHAGSSDSVQPSSALPNRSPTLPAPNSDSPTIFPGEHLKTPLAKEEHDLARHTIPSQEIHESFTSCKEDWSPDAPCVLETSDHEKGVSWGYSEFHSHEEQENDAQSLVTNDLIDEHVASIGSYAAQEIFGCAFDNIIARSALNAAAQNFVNDLLSLARGSDNTNAGFTSMSDGTDTQYGSGSSSVAASSSLKRKAAANGGRHWSDRGTDDGDDGLGGDENQRGNRRNWPAGRAGIETKETPSDRLEFMCPFRLKDPLRFNVRDWYDCATKVYICEESGSKRNELNELRRHLKVKHARPGVSSRPYCSTCKEQFPSAWLVDEHAKQAACVYRELPMGDDPLDGLTPDAERALSTRQGRQGGSALQQYRQICQIVLGQESELPGPGYLPVIEHFELHQLHLESLPALHDTFLRKLPSEFAHEVHGLLDDMHNHTVDVFDQCRIRLSLAKNAGQKRRKMTHRKFHKAKSSSSSRGDDDIPPVPPLPEFAIALKGKEFLPLVPNLPLQLPTTASDVLTSRPNPEVQWVAGHTMKLPSLSSLASSNNDSNQQSFTSPSTLLPEMPSSFPQQQDIGLLGFEHPAPAFETTDLNELFRDSWSAHLIGQFPPSNDGEGIITTVPFVGDFHPENTNITWEDFERAIEDGFHS